MQNCEITEPTSTSSAVSKSTRKSGASDPTQAQLHLLFEYKDGALVWRYRERMPHNAAWGRVAGYVDTRWGYVVVHVNGVACRRARLVWILHHGAIPCGLFIDHINGTPGDDRISNLRVVTNRENGRNAKRHPRNESGVTGVRWHKGAKKWTARIHANDRELYLGLFDSFDDAVAARKQAEKEHNYHPNHGRS